MSSRIHRRPSAGFTLLEVVVAMAILAMALMAIFDLNSGAVAMHAYTKKLTVASMLARGKMTDLEQKLYDEGFPTDDREEHGDFSDDGWPSFKWKARILAPKTANLDPSQVISAVLGVPLGGGGEGDPLSALFGGLTGGGMKGATKGGTTAGGPQPAGALGGMLGPMAGMAQGQFQQMAQQIGQSVREVQLTVFWKDGTQVESIDLVTHIVSQGPGGDRNGGPTSAMDNLWVDSVTGQVVPNPVPAPDGTGMINPQTGNKVVHPPSTPGATQGGGTAINPATGPGAVQGVQSTLQNILGGPRK